MSEHPAFTRRTVLILSVLFALPRVLRILYGRIWIEDPYYLYTPYLMMRGEVPYRDFSAPYITLLEEVFAYAFMVFGPSPYVFEVATAGLMFAATWCLFLIGQRLGGFKAGLVAAILFSWNYLIFRYHVQHREIYTTFFQAWLFWYALRCGEKPTWRQVLALGLGFGVGALCKQSIAVHVVPIFLLFLWRRQWLQAGVFAGVFNGLYWAAQGAMYLRYGTPFLINTVYFHFVKGGTHINPFLTPDERTAPWLLKLADHGTDAGVWILLGAFGIALGYWRSRHPFWLVLLADQAFNVAFNLLSLTFWPHYLVSILGASMIGCGYAIAVAMEAVVALARRERPQASQWAAVAAVPCLLALFALPSFRPRLPYPENLGFGGKPRSDARHIARFMQRMIPPGEEMIGPPYLALLARRGKPINFKDNYGNMVLLERLLAADNLDEARERFAGLSFQEVRGITMDEWVPEAIEIIRRREVAMVVPDFEFPVKDEILIESGYEICLQAMDYTFWCRKEGP